jgi:starch synthase
MGKVLSVASECVPLIKTGGLADVVGALPAALAGLGWEMRVLLPAYRPLRDRLAEMQSVMKLPVLFGGPAMVFFGKIEGLSLYLLDAPHLFDRAGGPYSVDRVDFPDNAERFAALSWVAAEMAQKGCDGWQPDVLHAHDWQAGFAPAYLRYSGSSGVGSVITVHNIAFQGWAPASHLGVLRLPPDEFHSRGLEYYNGLSSLKAGLVTADKITTVSHTYAAELMRPEFGMGLEGVIAARRGDVVGILNGVDTEVWSPEKEPVPFSAKAMQGKAEARAALCADLGLSVPGPLAVLVSRLTDQKGIDLLATALPDFIAAGGGLAILGSGDPVLEAGLGRLAAQHPERVSIRIGYDEAYSHRLFCAGDAVLVPSRFEPCGLTQMYGLRYGAVPVVSLVGGLADTVINASPAALIAGVATGIVFHPVDAPAFARALLALASLYADKKVWKRVQANAMRQPVGWEASARDYADLYAELAG